VANGGETRGLQRCREFNSARAPVPSPTPAVMDAARPARAPPSRLDLRDGNDRECGIAPQGRLREPARGHLPTQRVRAIHGGAQLRAHDRTRVATSSVGADVEKRRASSAGERCRWAASCAALISARSSSNVRTKPTSRHVLSSLTSSGGSSCASVRRRPSRSRRPVCVGSASRDSSDRWPFTYDHGVDVRIAWTMERRSRVRASGCRRWRMVRGRR
jgi:hypothetical protein